MIKNEATSPAQQWHNTAARAATEAGWLGPVATVLFAIAMLLIVREYFVQPSWEELRNTPVPTIWQAINQLMIRWVDAGAAISLAWALWEARLYLKRLEKGEVWMATTMKFLQRIGECLLVSAVFSTLVAPTIHLWIAGRGIFDWQLSAPSLVLAGLGLLLTMMARVLSQVLTTAEGLKADNEAIV